jgi:hypothetical protein
LTSRAVSALDAVDRSLASVCERINEQLEWVSRIFHWQGDPKRLRRRREPHRRTLRLERLERRDPFGRTLRLEQLEPRRVLTPTYYTLIVGAYVDQATGNDVITSNQDIKNFQSSQGGPPTFLPEHANAIIPASELGQTVEIADSGSLPPLTFQSLEIASGNATGNVTIAAQTSNDSIYVDPNYAMSVATPTGYTLTFTAPIVPLSAGNTTMNTSSNSGEVYLAGGVSITTFTASAGNVVVGANAAATIGTVNVNGAAFVIQPTASVTAGSVVTTAGTLEDDGALTINNSDKSGNGLTVSGNAVLTGAATASVTLAAGCGLDYTSSQDCDLTTLIGGSGFLAINCSSGNGFTLDNSHNSFSGGTTVYAGLLKNGSSGGLP